ncbi:MAG TPA: L-dopachrome tautomerase-related protein [Tepidisphaeraceae bacterium]|nr:L-dopachrome tautomerase-related protein [Tepidisphaeraceae bacterium]
MRYTKPALATIAAIIIAGCQQDKPELQTAANNNNAAQAMAQLASAKEGTISNASQRQVEPFALFRGPMPTGVAVSRDNRVFVNYPRWGDPVAYSVTEVKNGQAVPFPDDRITKLNMDDPQHSLISVQSVMCDARNRLWILDTGSINFQPHLPNATKLIAVDLNTNQVLKTISFPPDVALPTSYLNDMRFDLGRGSEGTAYLTDSSDSGPNGIVVVDIASGKSWRRLNHHPSTKAEPNFKPIVEGQPLMARPPTGPAAYLKMGSDGIALSPDGKTLYYCALASHHLYSVSTDALADQNKSDNDVAAAVNDLGDRGFASDGLLCDASGKLYLTDFEHNAIRTRDTNGSYGVLVSDARLIWPDSMAIGGDGYLYVTANQLNRQPRFHRGQDLRKQPYVLFRVKVDAQPSQPGANRAG